MPLSDTRRPPLPAAVGALLMVLAGVAHALSLAWPFAAFGLEGQSLPALQLVALGAVVAVLERCTSGRQAGMLAWLFATSMLAATFWWLYISMHVYGGLAAPLAALAVLALAAALGLYYALAGALYRRWRPAVLAGRVLLWAGLWLAAELARVTIFTGFPWGQSGYAHVDGWARPLAGWIGVHGLSWLSAAVAALEAVSDFIIIDCPGSHTRLSQVAHSLADTLITPLNDSFVDFDLLARVDTETGKVKGPSIYAEMVWNARQLRAQAGLKPIDWIVLRNRLGAQAMHNKRKVGAALEDLSRRIGFRVVPGFAERVIFRELFPRGLTVLDLKDTGVDQMNLSNVAARQEVRELMKSLRLPNVTVDF
jgi:hypothetical protein